MDCLECVRKHLHARSGRLILDVFQTDAERMHDPVHHAGDAGRGIQDCRTGDRCESRERVAAFHRAEQRNDVEMIFSVDASGRKSKERLVFAWTLRYFFRYEVEHLLARCGFRVAAVYGDFDRSPLRDHSPEMIFVAES